MSAKARSSQVSGINVAEASAKTLTELVEWTAQIRSSVPASMRSLADDLVSVLTAESARLLELGLGYLSLDRASLTLSTGERQRVQLSRAVRAHTTGILYVLDEPSVGLHPANVDGLLHVIQDLLADGNSVVVVDHDVQLLSHADWMIEIGPEAGSRGGEVVATGSVEEIGHNPHSRIGGFLVGREPVVVRDRVAADAIFAEGALTMSVGQIHTVHDVDISLPIGRLTAITGVSGSGKTTVILESLVPAIQAHLSGYPLPPHVRSLEAKGIDRVSVVDATPVGVNVRSTVATYSGIMTELRNLYGKTENAGAAGLGPADFSYNTGSLKCPRCEGTGEISLDVQFLPEIDIECPLCGGSRYAPEAQNYTFSPRDGEEARSLPALLALTVDETLEFFGAKAKVSARLRALSDIGLGYLTLGESTPALSGGEAQRLKLASQLRRDQHGALFVLDEPSVGLHPRDVQVLIGVLERLRNKGATVVVIEHDLDVIANADYIVDMGPGGGAEGGKVVATGDVEQVAKDADSVSGRYLARHLAGGAAS